ncbi:hypothetical protein OEA41_000199 [Lepraria neglecta]|uniref:SWR1-complex protein 5 n=1 Tax=Lepraria neglecta TaxID=209136 RepID=A0AAD9ZI72_9LECA|nr:hypothetical protein OEA41_000199 [Lepraria neglecta]
MPPLPPPAEEEDYDSAADSDFDASLSPSSADDSGASDGETATKTKKRKIDADGDVEMGSGDEGIVAQGKKKKKRKGKGKAKEGEEVDAEDEGEDGSVGVRVRLRSGRGGEESKNKPLAKTTGATIDIDSVWARLNNPEALRPPTTAQKPSETTSDAENIPPPSSEPAAPATSTPETTITIPHTYTFAGETHTSTKTVPASSPEAIAYLASKAKNPTSPTATGPTLRRPLARKGLLEPNPSFLIKGREVPPRADLPTSIGGKGTRSLGSSVKASQWETGKEGKAKKLNTVEKSKLDWEAEVERQGMREELEKAEKSGGSYLGRMEFLGRVEGGREEEARVARLKMRGLQG